MAKKGFFARCVFVIRLLCALVGGGLLMGCTRPAGSVGKDGAAGPAGKGVAVGKDGATAPQRAPIRLLNLRITGWVRDNATKINDLVKAKGYTSAGYNSSARPVALFDWDNTVVKNDIGEATFIWMVRHDKILQPPNKDWSQTSADLSADAVAALKAACGGLADAGKPLPTSTNTACADEIFRIYDEGKTVGGKMAWDNKSPTGAAKDMTLTNNSSYTWSAQLQAGYAANEIHSFARAAFSQNNWAPVGSTQTVGSNKGVIGYIRIYRQIRDLIRTLQENGFDVWVITASPQWTVEAISMEVNVSPEHVIGIRPVYDATGKGSYKLQPCGPDANKLVTTFAQGKRCWTNRIIFGVADAEALKTQADLSKRAVFAAGDSDTDLAFLQDATDLKLVINQNKTQVMCNACLNVTSKWIYNPMFIAPKARKTTPYACSTAKDVEGHPIKDENGAAFTKDCTEQ